MGFLHSGTGSGFDNAVWIPAEAATFVVGPEQLVQLAVRARQGSYPDAIIGIIG
ncbi:MAG TPA: hypothetical protein VGX03_13125 [Candidatus Binatia bacterium]|nr:hypothetical protein [Candidatus Binatia bacterium]